MIFNAKGNDLFLSDSPGHHLQAMQLITNTYPPKQGYLVVAPGSRHYNRLGHMISLSCERFTFRAREEPR